MKHSSRIDRRSFTKAASAAFAFTYIPRRVWGANERVNVAAVGAGGKGASDVNDIANAGGTYVALCDVDQTRCKATRTKFPNAKFYTDFREMLDKEKGIDAVSVSTPDHVHAIAALSAMALGKHVYVQKPLTYSVHEARLMQKAAVRFGVQTQMGNQAHAGEPIRRAVELIRAGIIGPIREVHAWTNRPIWPQGQAAYDKRTEMISKPKPADLDWDAWLGPAPLRDFNACYVPFAWRGWWDYGTGAVGDMACHIMDMPYWALDLGAPSTIEAESGGLMAETAPDWSKITYQFAARDKVGGGKFGAAVGPVAAVEQPAVKFVWYDGKRDGKENAPHELIEAATAEAKKLSPTSEAKSESTNEVNGKKKKRADRFGAGSWDLIMVGDQGMMLFNRAREEWIVTPGQRSQDFSQTPKTLPRVASEDHEWIDAIRGGSKPLGSFDYSAPFTETVILSTIAIRLKKKIEWDAKRMRAPNAPEADELIRRTYRKGWSLPVGDDILELG